MKVDEGKAKGKREEKENKKREENVRCVKRKGIERGISKDRCKRVSGK